MRHNRPAFTLLEITLVMGILVIVAALSMPVMSTMFNSARITAATDTVKSHWTRARSRAIEERRGYRFSIKENTGCFRVAPDSDEFWIDDNVPGDMGQGPTPLVLDGHLPEHVRFCTSEGKASEGETGEGGSWRTVAIFQPDGSAREDVEIAFGSSGGPPTILRLRAVTGDISVAVLRVRSNTTRVETGQLIASLTPRGKPASTIQHNKD